ncbi:MAG: RloB family protein [bacterium]
MPQTSRIKRPLDRTVPHLRDTRLIIIATEGEKSEKQYFEDEVFKHRRVQVQVLPTIDGKSASKYVLARLKEYQSKFNLQENDQLWMVVDKDRFPDSHLHEVVEEMKDGCGHAISLAVSTPCFELWLYLHHAAWTNGALSSKEMEKNIRKLLGGYNKAKIDMSKYRGGIEAAIARAKMLDTNPRGPWPQNPGTRVYKLVEAIQALRSKS